MPFNCDRLQVKTMKAVIFRQHGGLDQVTVAEVPKPDIKVDEVLVQIKSASLNRLDLWTLEGWPSLKLKMPHIMGSDGAGVVADAGSQGASFQVGDRVAINPTLSCGHCGFCQAGQDNLCQQFALFGEHVDGFFAEYAAVPVKNLVKIPANLPETIFDDAAAASLVFVTAWHSLIVRGQLKAGESVLIVGAGGGVNTAAVQVAKLCGAGPIYVVGSSDEKLALAKTLGADFTINRQEEEWGRAIFKATGRQGVNVVIDNVGAPTFHGSLRALAKGGRLLTVGNTAGPKFEIDNRLIFGKHLAIIGSSMGTSADFRKVMALLFSGRIRPVIDTVYRLSDGVAALRRLEHGEVSGKLLMRP